jgi:sensor domain CHASE-containing protein
MRFKEITISTAVLILLLSIWWTTAHWYERTLFEEQRLQVLAELTPYGNSLTTAINRSLLILEGLKNFTVVRSLSGNNIDPAEFATFAAEMYSVSPGIPVIHLSPGGVNRYVYPLEGNQGVLGHDLLHGLRLQVRQDVLRTIKTRRIALSDPYELRQGGWGSWLTFIDNPMRDMYENLI